MGRSREQGMLLTHPFEPDFDFLCFLCAVLAQLVVYDEGDESLPVGSLLARDGMAQASQGHRVDTATDCETWNGRGQEIHRVDRPTSSCLPSRCGGPPSQLRHIWSRTPRKAFTSMAAATLDRRLDVGRNMRVLDCGRQSQIRVLEESRASTR